MLRKTILTIFFSLFLFTSHQAFAQGLINAYVTDSQTNQITVIDVSTDEQSTIPVSGCNNGADPPVAQRLGDIIVDPSGTKLYVICDDPPNSSNIEDYTDRVFSISLVTGEQVEIGPVSGGQIGRIELAITPNGDFLFVVGAGDGSGRITVINARENTVITTLNEFRVVVEDETITLEELAVSRDSNFLFVGYVDSSIPRRPSIAAYDLRGSVAELVDFDPDTEGQQDLQITVTTELHDMIVSPDGSTLFVTNVNNDGTTYGDNVVRAFTINSPPTATAALLVATDDYNTEDGVSGSAAAEGSTYVRGMAFGPDGSLYVANAQADGQAVVRFAPDGTLAICDIMAGSTEVAVTPDGSKIYATVAGGRIAVCDNDPDLTATTLTADTVLSLEAVASATEINIVMGPGFYSSQNHRSVVESQLNAYYDLDNRRSFIQVSNLDNVEARTINVQIFQNGSDGCSDSSFTAEIPSNSTVFYDLDDLQEQGIDLGDNSHGYVVITPITVDMEGAITGIDRTAELIGNFRIIDNAGYEYRANMQNIRLGPATFATAVQIPDFVANFNNASGANQADVVGFGYTNRVSGNGAVSNMAGGVSFGVSCGTDRVTFACGGVMNYGISSDFGASRGDSVVCSGEQNDADALTAGYITFTDGTAPIAIGLLDGAFSGYIGINNGDGTGTMDSWIRTTP